MSLDEESEPPVPQTGWDRLPEEAKNVARRARGNCEKALNNMKLGEEAQTDREAFHRFALAAVSAQFATQDYLTILALQMQETNQRLTEILAELRDRPAGE